MITCTVWVKPEPGHHRLSTTTASPFSKKPQALPAFMAKFIQSPTSSAQPSYTGSLQPTEKMHSTGGSGKRPGALGSQQ